MGMDTNDRTTASIVDILMPRNQIENQLNPFVCTVYSVQCTFEKDYYSRFVNGE